MNRSPRLLPFCLAVAAVACADNGPPDVAGLDPKIHLTQEDRALELITFAGELRASGPGLDDPTYASLDCAAGWVRTIDERDAATGAFEIQVTCARPSVDTWYLSRLESLHTTGTIVDGRGSYVTTIDSFGWSFDDLEIPAQHVTWSFTVAPGAAGAEHRVGTSDRGDRVEGDYVVSADGGYHERSVRTYAGGLIETLDATIPAGPLNGLSVVAPKLLGPGTRTYDDPGTAISPDDQEAFDNRADGTYTYSSTGHVEGSSVGFPAGDWVMTVAAEGNEVDGRTHDVTSLDDPTTAVSPDYRSESFVVTDDDGGWMVDGTRVELFDDHTRLETQIHFASRNTDEGTIQTEANDWVWDDETTDVVDQDGTIEFDHEWAPDDHAVAHGTFTDHFPGGGSRTCTFTLDAPTGDAISDGPFETVIHACR